jgi:hypothetical protein
MTDLLIPIGHRIPLAFNTNDIPVQLRGMVQAALPTTQDIEDLPNALGGRDVKPHAPVLLWGPDGTQIMIMGAGEASLAEIQDVAYNALDKANERYKLYGHTIDIERRREQAGLPRREDVDGMIRDALRRRAQSHIDNPISDPPRIPERGE